MMLYILTVHKDDLSGLRRTYDSLRSSCALESPQVKWVIIDGASDWSGQQDFRVELEGLSSHFLSEPDGGIYDAMNKATRVAPDGSFVMYLNAGDSLCDAGFRCSIEELSESSADVIMFDSAEVGAAFGAVSHRKQARSLRWLWYGMPTHHQAIIFRRAKLGEDPYSDRFPLAGDYDLLCRLVKGGASSEIRHVLLCEFDLGGVSSRRYCAGLREQWQIRQEVLGFPGFLCGAVHALKLLARVPRIVLPDLYRVMRYT